MLLRTSLFPLSAITLLLQQGNSWDILSNYIFRVLKSRCKRNWSHFILRWTHICLSTQLKYITATHHTMQLNLSSSEGAKYLLKFYVRLWSTEQWSGKRCPYGKGRSGIPWRIWSQSGFPGDRPSRFKSFSGDRNQTLTSFMMCGIINLWEKSDLLLLQLFLDPGVFLLFIL